MKAFLLGASLAVLVAGCAQKGELRITAVGEQAVQTAPASLAKAQLLLSRGEYALAVDAYRKAVRLDPASAAAYNGLAIAYDQLGRHDLSRRNYEMALAHAPHETKYYRNLARSLERQGLKNEAARILAELDQGNAPAAARQASGLRSLAQIAGGKASAFADAVAGFVGPRLERLSLGEVLLATSSNAPQKPGRSITVPIPAPDKEEQEAELAARPGHSVTVAIPAAVPEGTREVAQNSAQNNAVQSDERLTDVPVATLATNRPLEPRLDISSLMLAAAADSGELMELAFTPPTDLPQPCPSAAPLRPVSEFDLVSTGGSMKVFTGDFAPRRLGARGNAIDLPLLYPASANLPVGDEKEQNSGACALHWANAPVSNELLVSALWFDWTGEDGAA